MELYLSRAISSRQGENWITVPWQLAKAAVAEPYRYYYFDHYETIIGPLEPYEILGTDSAYNCVNIAFTGNCRPFEL